MNHKDKISRYEKAEQRLIREKYGSKFHVQRKITERLKNRAVSKKEAHARDYSNGPHDYQIDLGEETIFDIENNNYDTLNSRTVKGGLYVSELSDEQLNDIAYASEREMVFWPCESLLDHAVGTIFETDKKRKMNNPTNYTDYDALMDWISKINDRREGRK